MTDNTQTGSDINVTRKDTLTEVDTHSIKGVHTELDEILKEHGGRLATYAELYRKHHHNPSRHQEDIDYAHNIAKQALLDWHNKRELEAMIDTLEYAKISPKFKIEEKIEQLRLELKKYEQSS